eukprot:GHVU01113740.1.p1 GENE.GHVU01113740.1~~GHVU01113740.1.p1  ORF type:complete len:355 (+),score=84.45 GHVU01113740.1:623-1687(+)
MLPFARPGEQSSLSPMMVMPVVATSEALLAYSDPCVNLEAMELRTELLKREEKAKELRAAVSLLKIPTERLEPKLTQLRKVNKELGLVIQQPREGEQRREKDVLQMRITELRKEVTLLAEELRTLWGLKGDLDVENEGLTDVVAEQRHAMAALRGERNRLRGEVETCRRVARTREAAAAAAAAAVDRGGGRAAEDGVSGPGAEAAVEADDGGRGGMMEADDGGRTMAEGDAETGEVRVSGGGGPTSQQGECEGGGEADGLQAAAGQAGGEGGSAMVTDGEGAGEAEGAGAASPAAEEAADRGAGSPADEGGPGHGLFPDDRSGISGGAAAAAEGGGEVAVAGASGSPQDSGVTE